MKSNKEIFAIAILFCFHQKKSAADAARGCVPIFTASTEDLYIVYVICTVGFQ